MKSPSVSDIRRHFSLHIYMIICCLFFFWGGVRLGWELLFTIYLTLALTPRARVYSPLRCAGAYW